MNIIKQLIMGLLLLSLAACGADEMIVIEPTPTATVSPPTPTGIADSDIQLTNTLRVCVLDVSAHADTPYWRDIELGLETAATDYSVNLVLLETGGQGDVATLEQCIADEAQVIITNTPFWSDILPTMAEQNPDIFFIGLNQLVEDGPPNYVGLLSSEDEVAFVVGYLAGLVTETNIVAGVYGIPVPALKRFRNGYEQGVAYAAEQRQQSIEVLGVYLESFVDPEAGVAAAQQFLDAGADVIFGAAGQTGQAAILHAAQQDVYVIGVDQDEYFSSFGAGQVAGSDKIITSAIKRINVGLFDLLSALIEGNTALWGGQTYFLNLANGGLAFALAHEADIPDEFHDQAEQVERALIQEDISTGVDFESGELLTTLPNMIEQVCLVADEALIQDDGFVQLSYQGIENVAASYNLQTLYLEELDSPLPTVEQAPELIQQCLDLGADVVITAGFFYDKPMLAAAEANPEIFFIGIDQFVQDGPENFVGVQFQEDEVGFLVGYLAGLVTESNVVAGVYGPDFPPLKRFRNGYEQGVRFAAQEREREIEALGVYLDAFDIPNAGAEAAQGFIEAGADVIFGAGGGSGNGAILYAAQQGTYVIGVDQDQYFTLFDGGEVDGADKLISSALKRVDSGVIDLLTILASGNADLFPGGRNYVLTVANGGLSFANPHQADVPDRIYDQVAALEQAIAEEELLTGVDPISGDLLE